jgi:hypothetical protein
MPVRQGPVNNIVRFRPPPPIGPGAVAAGIKGPWQVWAVAAVILGVIVAAHYGQQALWDYQQRRRRFLQQRRWGQLNPPLDGKRPATWQEVKNQHTQTFQAAGRFVMTYINRRTLTFTSPTYDWGPTQTNTSGTLTLTVDNVQAYELYPYDAIDKVFYGGLMNVGGTAIRFKVGGAWGEWQSLNSVGGIGNGGLVTTVKGFIQSEVQTLSHSGLAQPPALVPIHRGPGVFIDPAVEPTPTPYPPAPKLPAPATAPSPVGDPVTQPEPDQKPLLPPFPLIPGWRPNVPPIPAPPKTGTGPVPVTPPNVSFPWPGSGPVGGPGQAPQPSLEGIATEVGKIERKLEVAFTNPKGDKGGLNWEEWWDAVGKLYNLLISLSDAGQFTLSSPCVPADEPGGVNNPLLRQWDGSLTPGGGLEKRLDALAGLVQDSKNLRQPICNDHQPTRGIAHRVRFISDGVSPRNGKRYLKDLGYRDQSGRPLVEHREHWKTFRWESGPFLVSSRGLPWGQPQVWASSFEEGRRVLTHAAAIAGVDVSSESHRWFERVQPSTRNGVVESFGVARDRTGEVWVVARDGSDGWPELAPEFRTDL